jgi:methionyl-tRNA formyltransferase
MLPEVVWNMPPMGTLNLHGSLLPQYRGSAPINWAIINGEKFTGVTTFKLKHEIDTGDILLTEKIEINENETAGTLHDKMKIIGADLLYKTVVGLANNSIVETPQTLTEIKYAPKIFTETCEINWNQSCDSVHNLIRGLSPYPAAYTKLNDKKLKIFSSNKELIPHDISPGNFETDGKTYLRYACKDGYLHLTEIQLEGKKRMKIEDFLRGYRFS